MTDKGKDVAPAMDEPGKQQPEEVTPPRSLDKGKAPAVEVETPDLMDLKPIDFDKPLHIKVYRKWLSKNVPDPNPTGLCFILLDKKGGAIQANVQLWDMRLFETKLETGYCYKIERFGCKKTENWQRTLNNPMTLLFGKYTQVTPAEDEGFPDHYFDFLAYNELGQRANARDYTLTGGLQLSATPATYYYLNPRIQEADHIRQLYEQMGIITEPLQLPPTDVQQTGQLPTHRLTPVSVLMQATPESVVQQFTIEATITKIDEQSDWYFNRCRVCGNKIAETMPHRHCQQPGMKPLPNYSYSFRALLSDSTGTVLVTCFSPEAESLLGLKVTDLLSYIPEPDPHVIPPIIEQLENTSHVFHVHLAKGSRRGFPRFILDGVEDVPLPALPPIPTDTEGATSSATASSE